MLDLLGGGVDLLLALLATTTEAEDEVKSRLLLDVVVGQGAAIFELLAGEDETLLIRGNSLLVCFRLSVSASHLTGWFSSAKHRERDRKVLTLDLGLHIVDGIRRLHLEGDSLTRKGLDEDLHFDKGLRIWSASRISASLQFCQEKAVGSAMGVKRIAQ